MGMFLFAAIGLIGITMLMLLRPWQRASSDHDASAREINARIYRDQLAEIDRDLAAGTLAPADHAQARAELQRRLLDDSAAAAAGSPALSAAPRHTALVLAIVLPLAATGLYAWLGTPAALLPQAATQAQDDGSGNHGVTQAQIDQMVGALAARLEKNPNDPKGWSMLARSYRVMGKLPEAEAAFARVGEDFLNKDPILLAEYADTLAARANGNLEGRPMQLVNTALKIDPENQMALSLAATAAYNRKDFTEAARHWQHLLKQFPPESEEAKWLTKTLAEIGAPVTPTAAAGNAPATTAAAGDGAAAPGAGIGPSISGSVTLAPELQAKVQPTDTVFVFARAATGGRMPLAVQRAQVSDMPLKFKLDDSMALAPQFKLSGASEVRIEAVVSRSGNANPSSGDLIGTSEVVKPGNSTQVALRIDRVRP